MSHPPGFPPSYAAICGFVCALLLSGCTPNVIAEGMFDAHDRLKLTDNTIVIVTSDSGGRFHKDLNGYALNGPWRSTKRTNYEGGHRMPGKCGSCSRS